MILICQNEYMEGNSASKSRVSVATRPPVIHGLANSSSIQHTRVYLSYRSFFSQYVKAYKIPFLQCLLKVSQVVGLLLRHGLPI